MAATTRDIFALPGELSRAILASVEEEGAEEYAEANGRNAVLNRMALVGRLWHNALAPQAGACMPALTRHMTLCEPDMLAVAQIARPWWRWVRGAQYQITDAGQASLAAGFPAITRLELSYCRQITDRGLASLAAGCSAITTLNLAGCRQITDAVLASMGAGCSAITTLDLSGCDQITETGLASLAAECTAITWLELSYRDQITDTGLASLAAGCTAITTLDRSGCTQIADAGLASRAAGCPSIEIKE